VYTLAGAFSSELVAARPTAASFQFQDLMQEAHLAGFHSGQSSRVGDDLLTFQQPYGDTSRPN
jgi:hypothetical protein